MADKPDKFPDWATEEQADPVSGQLNRVEPPEFRKETGWQRREIPPRQWFNWQAWLTGRWIRWIEDRISDANTVFLRKSQNLSDIADAEAARDNLDVYSRSETIDLISRQAATVTLGGAFGTGQVRVLREGNRVTITGAGALAHDELSSPSSAPLVLPSWARPVSASSVSNTYSTSLTGGASGDVVVTSNGTFILRYRDPSGATIALTSSELVPSITYLVGSL